MSWQVFFRTSHIFRVTCFKLICILFQVTKLRFNQAYKKEYANTNSEAFKSKAAEIEDVLKRSVCKRIGCNAIVVTSIKKGSIIVDFNAVFESNNVTTSDLQAATRQALDSSIMAPLDPEKSSKPQARSGFFIIISTHILFRVFADKIGGARTSKNPILKTCINHEGK